MNNQHYIAQIQDAAATYGISLEQVKIYPNADPYSPQEWTLSVDIGTERQEFHFLGTPVGSARAMLEACEWMASL